MFPESLVADEALSVVRLAMGSIFDHAAVPQPVWIDFDHAQGWPGRLGLSDSATATLITGGTSPDDPTAVRICFVAGGIEHISSVHPKGFEYANEVDHLVGAVNIPINAIRVYEGQSLIRELLLNMRGNA